MYEILLSKVGDKLLDLFAGKVIRRWSQYRSKRFFGALVEGLAKGAVSEGAALSRIERVLEDETKSEALFEAYRRVCLSASRNIGPKLIGLLAAKILAEDRTANEEEEKLFMAAEQLSDGDFKSLLEFLREAASKHGEPFNSGKIFVKSHSEVVDSNWPRVKIDISPLNLGEAYGSWALKAVSAGLLSQHIMRERREYLADPERYVDMDGVVTDFAWFIGFDSTLFAYLDLIALSAKTPE